MALVGGSRGRACRGCCIVNLSQNCRSAVAELAYAGCTSAAENCRIDATTGTSRTRDERLPIAFLNPEGYWKRGRD